MFYAKCRKWIWYWCLGYSNWAISTPLHLSHSEIIPSFSPSYWEANSYYPRGPIMGKGNSSNFKIGWDRGVWVPRAFKLDHFQPIEPILFRNIFNFFTFILGGLFLLPQRPIMGKGNSSNFKTEWDRRFSVPGAFKLDHLQPIEPILFQKIFNFLHFHTGRPILITPEGQ